MKKIYLIFLFGLFCMQASAQPNHVVISQVYGGGGNSGAPYTHDFVELFNPTGSAVDLTGWSIQYASAGGNFTGVTSLSGSIAAGGYYLIRLSAGSGNGIALPDHDATGGLNLSGTAGKIALASQTLALGAGCSHTNLIDLVGYGTTASCYEGSGSTPAPTNATSVIRAGNGCTDTDDNAADFTTVAPNPRNSASNLNPCAAVSSITTSDLATSVLCIAGADINTTIDYSASGSFNTNFTAYLSDASGSFASATSIGSASVNGTDPAGSISITIPPATVSGSGYRIRVEATSPALAGTPSAPFEIINGVENVSSISSLNTANSASLSWTNPTSCFEEVMVVVKEGSAVAIAPAGDGSLYIADNMFTGSGTLFDGGKVVYKGSGETVSVNGLTSGEDYYITVFSRNGTSWSAGITYTISSLGVLNHLVISQVYGGGGNSGAPLTNDYVELFNPTTSAIDLTGYSIQYTSATGDTWGSNKLDLAGTIYAGKYFLVQLNGGANGVALPTPDQTGTINMSATNGKILLAQVTSSLTGDDCPTTDVVDFVGFGTANCSETAAAPAASATTALSRASGGCADTDHNANDFTTSDPNPRNSTHIGNDCSIASIPLPVVFSGLKAVNEAGNITVYFNNETETNIFFYSVERSSNGINYTKAGTIKDVQNHGELASYSFIDKQPLSGDSWYRIVATEMNGKMIYSHSVKISNKTSHPSMLVYPNPMRNGILGLQIQQLPEGNYDLVVYNTHGQVVKKKTIRHIGGSVTETLDLENASAGIYHIRLNGKVVLEQKLVIQ